MKLTDVFMFPFLVSVAIREHNFNSLWRWLIALCPESLGEFRNCVRKYWCSLIGKSLVNLEARFSLVDFETYDGRIIRI